MLALYENIKRLRLEAGMTQDDLAKRLGYTDRSMIAKIEGGGVDLSESKISAFAHALGVTPVVLMGWEDPAPAAVSLSRDEEELIHGYRVASPDRREDMLDLARKALKNKEGANSSSSPGVGDLAG